jgi:hypothetical protein
MAYLEELSEEHRAEWSRAIRFIIMLILNLRDATEHSKLVDIMKEAIPYNHLEEVEDMVMNGVGTLRQLGRQEGRREGRQEGYSDVLLAQLEDKFGPLSEQTVTAVKALPLARLEKLTHQILTAKSLNELKL